MKYRHTDKCDDSGGFTLIEVLVVVVIIGILSSIAAPGWLSFLQRQRMSTVRGDLLGALRTAQAEAISKKESRSVILSNSNLSITIRPKAASTGGIVTTLGSGEANGQIHLAAASTSLVFDYKGRVDVATPFVINITHDDSSQKRCVIVTTLLGGLKPAADDMCTNFASTP